MEILETPPPPHPENVVKIADFAELECFRRRDRNVSVVDIARILQRTSAGNDDGAGAPDEGPRQIVDEAFEEIEARQRAAGRGGRHYPFEVSPQGTLIQLKARGRRDLRQYVIYLYLLLATRLNMKTQWLHGGEDGTALFEELCCEVGVRFWGGPSEGVGGLVFGAARLRDDAKDDKPIGSRRFRDAVNNLCKRLGEGGRFSSKGSDQPTARDGKLDVVVWRSFADGREGRLIGFGQCKTGTHWESDLLKLCPEGFTMKWMERQPAVSPTRLYFITDRVTLRWYDRCVDGGILFDRCRVLEYSRDLPTDLLKRIERWTRAALRSERLV